ncbi:MAG: hypothetical protein DRQ55_08455 [Planctomycetota bacterium]|nr:MAG: hypothetical protein DRQ55_08455 [Planctomycetota bacterium]
MTARAWASLRLARVLGCVLGCVLGLPGASSQAQADPGTEPGAAALAEGPALASPEPSAAPSPFMRAAVEAYRERRYAAAWRGFAVLASAEPDQGRRAVLHANAGTAAARAEAFGEAVWHLNEALRGAPRDVVARRNLHQLNLRLGAGRASSEDLTETLVRLPLVLTRREAHLAGTSMAVLALLLVALRRAGLGGRRLGFSAGLMLSLALVWWGLDTAARELDDQRAVVLVPTSVHGEPSADGKLLFRLDPGTLVRHEERRSGWVLVETLAGGRGWMPSEQVRRAGG